MLNQSAVDIHTSPVKQCVFHLIQFLENATPFYGNAEPQKWAAKLLGHAWCFGKRFCKSSCVLFSTYPQELNPWSSRRKEPLHSSTVEKSEKQTPVQDQRCQFGPSAKNSVIPYEGDSSKNYGADQQRLQISDLHFDKCSLSSRIEPMGDKH